MFGPLVAFIISCINFYFHFWRQQLGCHSVSCKGVRLTDMETCCFLLINFTLCICNGHANPANNRTEKSSSWEANGLSVGRLVTRCLQHVTYRLRSVVSLGCDAVYFGRCTNVLEEPAVCFFKVEVLPWRWMQEIAQLCYHIPNYTPSYPR